MGAALGGILVGVFVFVCLVWLRGTAGKADGLAPAPERRRARSCGKENAAAPTNK